MKRFAKTCLPMSAAAVAAIAVWIALAAPTLSSAAPAGEGAMTGAMTEAHALADLYARTAIRSSADLFPGYR